MSYLIRWPYLDRAVGFFILLFLFFRHFTPISRTRSRLWHVYVASVPFFSGRWSDCEFTAALVATVATATIPQVRITVRNPTKCHLPYESSRCRLGITYHNLNSHTFPIPPIHIFLIYRTCLVVGFVESNLFHPWPTATIVTQISGGNQPPRMGMKWNKETISFFVIVFSTSFWISYF